MNSRVDIQENLSVNQTANIEKHAVQFKHLYKSFAVNGQTVKIIEDFNLAIHEGEFLAIVGSSGCGKSTLLRLLTGLDREFEGEILVSGQPVKGLADDRAVVFQERRLFPWLTVTQNIELGLINARLSNADKQLKIQQAIELIHLSGFEQVYPHQLSGGMAQRVAIARSLVSQPKLFLLDEPFGALDALTRHSMQNELLKIHAEHKITTIFITHDVEEAVTLADRVVILKPKPGRIDAVIEVKLARPRNRSCFELHQLKEHVFSILTDNKI